MTEIRLPTRLNYYPHKAQLPFHEDRYKVRNRGLIGAGGSGKTEAGCFEALSWSFENPGSVGLICAPTYKMLKRFIIPKLQKLLNVTELDNNPFVHRYHRGDMYISVHMEPKDDLRLSIDLGDKLSDIWMVGLDQPESAEGMNLDWAYMDEARLVPKFESARMSIQRRLRGSGKAEPVDDRVPPNAVGFWVTTTPNAPGSDLYNFFENPHKRNPESKVYRVSLDDNRDNLTQDFIDEMKRTHTGGLYERFVLGRFAAVSLGSFAFDYSIHVQDFEKYYNPENVKKLIYGVDFGWTNPAAIITIALDGDNRVFVLDEVYGTRLSEEDIITECILAQDTYGKGTFWCDSSEPRTITALRRVKLDAKPNKSKRDEGIRELGGRFKAAGDGRHRIYIHPRCVNLIEELQIYDADKKEHDHATDGLRYGLMGAKTRPGRIEGTTVYREREIVI